MKQTFIFGVVFSEIQRAQGQSNFISMSRSFSTVGPAPARAEIHEAGVGPILCCDRCV